MATHETPDSEEMSEFVRKARAAITVADPPPDQVANLAKIAFQFRDITTAAFDDPAETAPVRSLSRDTTLQVSKDGSSIIWTLDAEHLSGVVIAEELASLQLQTTEGASDLDVDAADGSFEAAAPVGPYRLVVRTASSSWSSPWTTM